MLPMSLLYPSLTVNSMLRYESGIEPAMAYVRGELSYENTLIKLGRIGLTAETMVADVHIQEAVWSPGEADTLLNRAEDVLDKRVNSGEQGFDLRAANRWAQLPLYRALLGNPKFPEADTVMQAQHLMLYAAGIAVEHDTYELQDPSRERHLKVGTMADSAVLLLLSGFAGQSRLREEWLPVSSTLAEKLSSAEGASGWDINIYIPNRKRRPTLGYKLEVKSRLRSAQKYAKDIAVVAVSSDLTAGNETSISSSRIIEECQRIERRDNPSKTMISKNAERTDKLLTILDRTK